MKSSFIRKRDNMKEESSVDDDILEITPINEIDPE